MKHELEDQLKAFEKKWYRPPPLFQTDGNGRFTDCCKYPKGKAFSSKAKGKIVIIGGGAAGISNGCPFK